MQSAQIDLSRIDAPYMFEAVQGDTDRQIRILLTDDGEPYDVSDDTVSIWYKSGSTEGNFSDGITKASNELIITLNGNMTKNPGRYAVAALLNRSNGKVSTWNMVLNVQPLPGYGSEAAGEYFEAFQAAELAKEISDLNTRISNIVANAGDTGNNTELVDIRLGYDGTTYPTAGDAVREQVNNINSKINDIINSATFLPYEPVDVEVKNGYDNRHGVEAENPSYSCGKLSVLKGDVILISYLTSNLVSQIPPYLIVDDNGGVLYKGTETYNATTNVEFEAPYSGTLYINHRSPNYFPSISKKGTVIFDKRTLSDSFYEYSRSELDFKKDIRFDNYGNEIESIGFYVSDYIPIVGDTTVVGIGYGANSGAIFVYNKDKKIVKEYITTTNVTSSFYKTDEIHLTKNDGEYVRVCSHPYTDPSFNALSSCTVQLYATQKNSKDIEGLSSDIEGLSSTVNIINEITPLVVPDCNPWSDGKWRVGPSQKQTSYIFRLEKGKRYDIISINQSYMALTDAIIDSPPSNYQSFASTGWQWSPSIKDSVVINSIQINRQIASNFLAEYNTLIISGNDEFVANNPCKVYEKTSPKGVYSLSANANKRIAILGDSVSQQPKSEYGKELVRDRLNVILDTYGVGGSGFGINSYATWSYDHNTSAVYQMLELVKDEAESYDIYCLSCTLNDPITHSVPLGDPFDAYPYKKSDDGSPNLTDPDLETMSGGLNFIIQKLYEKNPSAKIIIGTMNKAFSDSNYPNGLGKDAGWNPLDTTTNNRGSTYYQYYERVKEIAQIWGLPLVDIYSGAGINVMNYETLMDDGYHPNVEGYLRIWELWFEKILSC